MCGAGGDEKKKMNGNPDLASAWCGRLLVKMTRFVPKAGTKPRTHLDKKKKSKKFFGRSKETGKNRHANHVHTKAMHAPDPGDTSHFPPSAEYRLRVTVLLGSGIPAMSSLLKVRKKRGREERKRGERNHTRCDVL